MYRNHDGINRMKINSKIRYGIRTMVELTLAYGGKGILQKDISDNQEISLKYLDQIIASLKAAGLIVRIGGRKGGYALARQPQHITTYDIYKAFEGDVLINDCIHDEEMLSQKKFCAVIEFWDGLNTQVIDYLKSTSLADIAERQKKLSQESEELVYMI